MNYRHTVIQLYIKNSRDKHIMNLKKSTGRWKDEGIWCDKKISLMRRKRKQRMVASLDSEGSRLKFYHFLHFSFNSLTQKSAEGCIQG